MTYEIHVGDCLDVLRAMPDNSVDAIVTDPPYGLTQNKKGGTGVASVNLESPYGRARIGTGNGAGGFMGHKWDSDVPSEAIWRECLRVLKPGGYLLAFAGTRTQHRMAVRIEDAGFEIRDMIAWVYGSGFPKSLDVSKAIDKSAGADREVVGEGPFAARRPRADKNAQGSAFNDDAYVRPAGHTITAPATEAARQWQGWGTALKPALEPITVARKPLVGTVAANVLEHGTGALNIDGARLQCQRWPANLIHDGSEEVLEAFPQAKGQQGAGGPQHGAKASVNTYGDFGPHDQFDPRGDTGSAARFFYCAKASRSDRNEGLGGGETPAVGAGATMRDRENADWPARNGNHHPTVKPTDLMAYLVRLVTPPGGVVLDPFMGSGSTGKACMREGFHFIGCDLSADYTAIAKARIEHELRKLAPASEPQQPGETLPLFETEAA